MSSSAICIPHERIGFLGAISALLVVLRGILGHLQRFLTTVPRSVRAPASLGAEPRAAVLVIDASPSMDDTDWRPSRLEAAQRAAQAYIQRLAAEEPDARVAIVAYNVRARTVCDLISVSEAKRLTRAVRSITTDSYTNITAGLKQALAILKRNGAAVCQVVLLTDGHHNSGSRPETVAVNLRKIAVLESVGIGGSPADVDEALLRSISSSYPDGSKRYRWIGDKERLVQHFHKLAGRITRS